MIKVNVDSQHVIKTKVNSTTSINVNTIKTNNTKIDIDHPTPINIQSKELLMAYGYSAYDLAVQNGYEGTVQEWLEYITGKSPYVNEQTNTWWAYDNAQGWYDTEIIANTQHPLLKNIVISNDDCLIINCGDSVNVMGG